MNIGYHGVLEGTPSYGWTSCFQSSHVRFLHARGPQFTSSTPHPWLHRIISPLNMNTAICEHYCYWCYCRIVIITTINIILIHCFKWWWWWWWWWLYILLYIYICVCVSKCIYQEYNDTHLTTSICIRMIFPISPYFLTTSCLSPFNFSAFSPRTLSPSWASSWFGIGLPPRGVSAAWRRWSAGAARLMFETWWKARWRKWKRGSPTEWRSLKKQPSLISWLCMYDHD